MSIQVHQEAQAFRKLVAHLQENNDVQNMDIMNLAGFCRNCLSKWHHSAGKQLGFAGSYDDSLELVYGMPYAEWKRKFQTPATPEQLALFKQNKHRHAKHEPTASATTKLPVGQQSAAACANPRHEPVSPPKAASSITKGPKMSSACCDPDDAETAADMVARLSSSLGLGARSDAQQQLPVPEIRIGVITVSDRASQGVYEDLSGPEVRKCLQLFANATGLFAIVNPDDGGGAAANVVIVPDEQDQIKAAIVAMCETCDVVLTTGGTGLSARDVTPEATLAVVEREVRGIPEAIRRETSRVEPLAMLSRAVAGIRGRTLVVNLPGRPKACREALGVLMPVLPHAFATMST
jgi:molybdopterin adenylyltransferase